MRFWGMFRFTMGEALRKGTLIFYFAVGSLILLLLTLGIGHAPDNPDLVTLFGAPLTIKSNPDITIVDSLLFTLHRLSIFWIMLFGIFGIAGLIPEMLEKGTIDLFLSKPLARTELLMARALGAVTGIALNLLYFFLGIWIIFGLKLGVWHTGFLSSVIYVVFAFVCFSSVVTLIGLITRSTGYSILLAFCFTLFSWGLEGREYGLYLLWDNVVYRRLLDGLYYLTPQLDAMLTNSSRVIVRLSAAPPELMFSFTPYLCSLCSASLIYVLAAWYFSRRDF